MRRGRYFFVSVFCTGGFNATIRPVDVRMIRHTGCTLSAPRSSLKESCITCELPPFQDLCRNIDPMALGQLRQVLMVYAEAAPTVLRKIHTGVV